MASKPVRDLSDYPRPWFYRPEIYYGLIVFPPVWSILTLRSPWHKGEGFFGIFIGGLAWFFLIAGVVMSVKWVQADDDGNRHVVNLFIFVPGILLTLLTQIQWAAHRARHGPPPTEDSDAPDSPSPVHSSAQVASQDGDSEDGESSDVEAPASDGTGPRRRRRRRRRPISRSADSPPLC